MTEPETFRKKPIEITAKRWPGGPRPATHVIDWVLEHGGTARYHEERTHDTSEAVETGEVKSFERSEPVPEHIAIDTLEGTMRALPGDWIVRGIQGEFYPVKPDIFDETYDRSDEEILASAEAENQTEPAEGQTVVNNSVTYEPNLRIEALHLANEHAKTQGDTADNTIKRAEKYLAFLKGESTD